jgi:hypothetical protein
MWGAPKAEAKYTFLYTLRDLHQPNRFKVGISENPDARAKREDWRLHGKPRLPSDST